LYKQQVVACAKTGETLEEALERTHFSELWEVIQAMKEHDDDLSAYFQKAQQHWGEHKQKPQLELDKINILGPTIQFNSLQEAIHIKMIAKLGSAWDLHYGELINFKKQYGHCRVPFPKHGNFTSLSQWVSNQRIDAKAGRLREERRKKLDSIGFEYAIRKSPRKTWDQNFEEYLSLKKQNKHYCNVWAKNQRVAAKSGKLSPEHRKKLHAIEFEFVLQKKTLISWDEFYEELKEFEKKFGHIDVPYGYDQYKLLALWVRNQRKVAKKGYLSAEKRKKLDALRFC
jgi:hypothetical protein